MKYLRRFTRWINRYLPPFVVMAVIFWFSSQTTLPGPGLMWGDFLLKKTAHIVIFGTLFFFWQRALNWKKDVIKRNYLTSFLLVLAYAIVDEIHQSFTPGRYPKMADIGFDMLGAFLVYYYLKFERTDYS